MNSERLITYTLRERDLSTMEVALWVRKKLGNRALAWQVLDIARKLQQEPWTASYYWLVLPREAGPCSFEITEPPDPWAAVRESGDAAAALLAAGAAGDAVCAIEYCKLVAAGGITNQPMA